MTSSLSPAAAPVIVSIGIPDALPFASGPFASGLTASGLTASGPTASGERVRVIDDSRPNIQAGGFAAGGANELLFGPGVRAGRGRPTALLRTVGLQDVRDKDPAVGAAAGSAGQREDWR